MFLNGRFGIVAENTNQRISIFDTGKLETVQQIPLDADVIDVALTGDCRRAVVTSFSSRTIFQIDLCAFPAKVVASAMADTFLEDVALTQDNRFALIVDGSGENQAILSYSLKDNAFVSSLPTSAQAVAISPKKRSLVLTAVDLDASVRRFKLSREGALEDTGQLFPAGPRPINVSFSPDGKFAFVANFGGGVSVLSTRKPGQITLLQTVTPPDFSMSSLAITRDGRHVFALSPEFVSIYSFDPVAGSLTFQRSFAHGLTISPFFGVEQIVLDASEMRLFVSGLESVAVFTTYGLPLGTVAGASGPGGIAICRCPRLFPRLDRLADMIDSALEE